MAENYLVMMLRPTLRNLPAEIVDKIQIFDRLNDQAPFTGLDDGSSTKGLNIITKKHAQRTIWKSLRWLLNRRSLSGRMKYNNDAR